MTDKIIGQVSGKYIIDYIFYPHKDKSGGTIKLSMCEGNLIYQTELKESPIFNYENLYNIILEIEAKETNSCEWEEL